MISTGKEFAKKILHRFPRVEGYLKDRRRRKKFSIEWGLIQGRHFNENRHASIIYFSLNKSATQYTKGILRRCIARNGMVNVDIPAYAFDTDFPFLDKLSADEMLRYRHIFKPVGYLYSAFGGMIEGISGLDQYKVILMVRDPRDILVSCYYSMAYSHPVPDKRSDKFAGFMKERRAALETTLDDYVIAESDKLYGILQRYKDLLLDKYPHVHLTTYEKMVSDFHGWLTNLLNYCDIVISNDLRRSLIEENDRLRPKKENVHEHIRKGAHGDYKNKLRPDTIDYLNEKFSPLLEVFGYTKDGVKLTEAVIFEHSLIPGTKTRCQDNHKECIFE
jgi:hypothetical protein